MTASKSLLALAATVKAGVNETHRRKAAAIDPNAEGVYRVATVSTDNKILQYFARNGEMRAGVTDDGVFTSFREAQAASNRCRCQLAANFRGWVKVIEVWRRGETGRVA